MGGGGGGAACGGSRCWGQTATRVVGWGFSILGKPMAWRGWQCQLQGGSKQMIYRCEGLNSIGLSAAVPSA